jgi:hypothetical protein
VLDQGEAIELSEEAGSFIKLKLKGKKLKGLWGSGAAGRVKDVDILEKRDA